MACEHKPVKLLLLMQLNTKFNFSSPPFLPEQTQLLSGHGLMFFFT